jgi:biopolymer transport protein TolR
MALKGKSPQEVSAINVTPMCDVMLVLLIIFMVITPLLQNNVSVAKYQSQYATVMNDANKTNAAVLTVTRDGKIYLNKDLISMNDVATKVVARLSHNLDKTVFLKSDVRAKYGVLLQIYQSLRAANVQDLALLTEQAQTPPPPPPPPPSGAGSTQ